MFTNILNTIDRIIKFICILLFTSLLVIISLQIIARYIFQTPYIWTEEGASLIFIWLCFLGGTIAYRKNAHISIDFFINILNPTTKKIVTSIILLLIAVFFIFLALISIPLIERGTLLRVVTLPWINWGYVYLSVQLSSIIMCLYSIENLFNVWRLTKIQTSP